jgi:hypothetical protein
LGLVLSGGWYEGFQRLLALLTLLPLLFYDMEMFGIFGIFQILPPVAESTGKQIRSTQVRSKDHCKVL